MFQVTLSGVIFEFPTRQVAEAFREKIEQSGMLDEVSDVQYTGNFTYTSEDDGLEHTARTIDWSFLD